MSKERVAQQCREMRELFEKRGKPFEIEKARPRWVKVPPEYDGDAKTMVKDVVTKMGGYFKGNRLPTVEETGKGQLLCYLGYSGRFFRSDEGCVRDEIDYFIDEYNKSCERYDADPANEYEEALSLNDLYYLLGVTDSYFGHQWVYPNTEEYRVHLKINVKLLKKEDFAQTTFEGITEDVLLIEPDHDSYPIDVDYLDMYC